MRKPMFIAALAASLALLSTAAPAQIGPLIWSDECNTLDNWLKITGNGDWGWGNGELECYLTNNVDIADVPGETGNKAIRIIGKAETGAAIVDKYGNPLNYSSGKLITKSFVSVRYGMIEARVRVPGLATGGWPAFWLLGTSTAAWPNCGEVDMMEMGAKKAFRDMHDTHNGGNGLDNSTENMMVGANAIYYSASAVNSGNPSGAASLAYDPTDVFDRPYYSYSPTLTERFLIYRAYWDSTSMRFTVTDNGVEHDLYTTPFTFNSDAAAAFRQPMYLLANLAIGGAYTDAYTLYNPGAGGPVTMPLPGTMYLDYVRVYKWNGQGEVHLGPPTQENGRFGLYSDTTPMTDAIVPGVSSDVYVWANTLVAGSIAPYEGANVLSWKTNAQGWFGAGIMSRQPVNLFGFGDGTIKFRIKIPANVSFKIGIIDTWGNQNYVDFPASTTKYGLVRNGQWGQAAIPVADIRGLAMDLRMLTYEFVILETNGTACEFALDDIYWQRASVAGVPAAVPAPAGGLRLAAAPNPFRGDCEMRFDLPAAAPYGLEVFDVAGNRVAGFHGDGVAGTNVVRWDGHRVDGRAASPGVYWYRLTAGGRTANRQAVLLR